MFAYLRRRRAAVLATTSFCDSTGQVCTAQCRARAHHDQIRAAALTYFVPR